MSFFSPLHEKEQNEIEFAKKIKAKHTLWHIELATLVLGEDHGENW